VFTFGSDAEGRLYTISQVQDYALRGMVFSSMSFLDFTVDTYEVRKEAGNHREQRDVDGEDDRPRVGRPRNVRGCYLSNHPKFDSHFRIQRVDNHNYLPNIVGRWFPRRDQAEEEEFYYASILALLRPWRVLRDLKDEHRTWKEEGLFFLDMATESQRTVIAGMQY
jgi:hypothetical protein